MNTYTHDFAAGTADWDLTRAAQAAPAALAATELQLSWHGAAASGTLQVFALAAASLDDTLTVELRS